MTARRSILAVVVGLACTVSGTGFWFCSWATDAAAKDRIRAAHEIHRQNDIACEVCHESATTSTSGTDNLIPGHDVCANCHDVEDTTKCAQCHSSAADAKPAPRVTTIAQKNSHAAHAAKGIACGTCHAADGAAAGDLAGEPRLPEMAQCRSCHETASDRSDCALCHADSEPLRPPSHGAGWTSFHGVEARVEHSACGSCHAQTECQDCHAGDNVRPRVHPLEFAFDHALAARGNEAACATCHEDRETCSSCHAAQNVLPENHSRADWVFVTGGGRHAEEGRFDIESCMACHDTGTEAPTCAPCHGR